MMAPLRRAFATCPAIYSRAPIHSESNAASTCRTPALLSVGGRWPEAQHMPVRTGPILSGHDHRCLSQQNLTMLGAFVWTRSDSHR